MHLLVRQWVISVRTETGLSSQVLPSWTSGAENPCCASLLTPQRFQFLSSELLLELRKLSVDNTALEASWWLSLVPYSWCRRTEGRLGLARGGDEQWKVVLCSTTSSVLSSSYALSSVHEVVGGNNSHVRAKSFFEIFYFQEKQKVFMRVERNALNSTVCYYSSINFCSFSHCWTEGHTCIESSTASLGSSQTHTKKSSVVFKSSSCDHCLASHPSVHLKL